MAHWKPITHTKPSRSGYSGGKVRIMKTRYYENDEVTTKIDYRFIGYGLNTEAVYQKIITTFSIADGILKDSEQQTVKGFYR